MITYEIRSGENAPCELHSVVTREDQCLTQLGVWHDVGHTYNNFICEGTW